MTNKQFYSKLHKTIISAYSRIQEAKAAYNAALADQADPKYSAEYKRTVIAQKVLDARFCLDEETNDARRELYGIIGDYAQQLRDEDTLKGADMNDDAKLLNCGIKLEESDLIPLLRRNENNTTMQQLIFRYAKQNNINLGNLTYIGNSRAIQAVEALKTSVDYTIKWINDFTEETSAATIARTWGEGSRHYNTFMSGVLDDVPDIASSTAEELTKFEGGAAAAIAEANDKIADGQ